MSAEQIDPAHLSAFIASRICHDLVSPVSSVTSALDLLDDPTDTEMREQAQMLLKKGAQDASYRLQFLRYAFGSMGLSPGAADIHEAKSVTERFVETHKPSVEWDIETDHLSYSHARLMMNLVLIAVDCLPRGGVIAVKIRNEGAGMSLVINAKGTRARLRDDTAQGLAGNAPEDGWSGRSVQPAFAKMIAEGLGAEVMAKAIGEEEIVITALGVRAEG